MGRRKAEPLEDSEKKEIISRIFAKYNSQKELAEVLGIAESTLTGNLHKMTPGFKKRLSKIGINIDGAITQNYTGSSGSSQTEGDLHGNFIGEPTEINYGVKDETIIRLIQSHDKQVEFLRKIIEQKDAIITELKRQLERNFDKST